MLFAVPAVDVVTSDAGPVELSGSDFRLAVCTGGGGSKAEDFEELSLLEEFRLVVSSVWFESGVNGVVGGDENVVSDIRSGCSCSDFSKRFWCPPGDVSGGCVDNVKESSFVVVGIASFEGVTDIGFRISSFPCCCCCELLTLSILLLVLATIDSRDESRGVVAVECSLAGVEFLDELASSDESISETYAFPRISFTERFDVVVEAVFVLSGVCRCCWCCGDGVVIEDDLPCGTSEGCDDADVIKPGSLYTGKISDWLRCLTNELSSKCTDDDRRQSPSLAPPFDVGDDEVVSPVLL